MINQIRKSNPNTTIEVLTPDFLRKGDAYKKVLKADLDVFNHNIETVPRLYLKVRPGARYFASLELLKNAKNENRSALISYTVCGDNNKKSSLDILKSISKNLDIVEWGIPHNCPTADGKDIQNSSYRALKLSLIHI